MLSGGFCSDKRVGTDTCLREESALCRRRWFLDLCVTSLRSEHETYGMN